MTAKLIYSHKDIVEGCIREVVIWHLLRPVSGCNHRFKYRFYFGSQTALVLSVMTTSEARATTGIVATMNSLTSSGVLIRS